MPDDLRQAIREHKNELLDHLAAHERITPEEYEALTPEQKHFYQPATGKKQTLTWEEAGRLIEEGTTAPEPGTFEHEADILLLESTRRIAQAWPKGCLLDGPEWERLEEELHGAYWKFNRHELTDAIKAREQYALRIFEAHRKEAEPNQTQHRACVRPAECRSRARGRQRIRQRAPRRLRREVATAL